MGATQPSPYEGPGIEAGVLVVPAVVVVAVVCAIVVAFADPEANPVAAGVAAIIAGALAWLVLWETFARLHPRFSSGVGETVKYAAVVAGPPVVAVAAAAFVR